MEETVKSVRKGASNSGWEMEFVIYLARMRSVTTIRVIVISNYLRYIT
jgi:hypothetical protein